MKIIVIVAAVLALAGCSVDNFTGPNPPTPSISAIRKAMP